MIPIKISELKDIAIQYKNEIIEFIMKRNSRILERINKKINRFFKGYNLEKLILIPAKELASLVKMWDKNKNIKKLYIFNDIKSFYNYLNKKNNKKRTIAYELINKLQINVCPYCNRTYIYNTENRTSELDHFYSKSKYPFLAISFYNLIPSCKNCNQFKRIKTNIINPYDENLKYDSISFQFKINKSNFAYKIESFELIIINNNIDESVFNNHLEILQLQDLYDHHKDHILELLQKR